MNIVYRHLNIKGDIIYVGLTTTPMKIRQSAHESRASWWEEIDRIEYVELSDSMLMEVYEKYYISKYTPKYNKKSLDCDYAKIFKILEELEFKEYIKQKRKTRESKEIPPFVEVFEEYYKNTKKELALFNKEFRKNGVIKDGFAYLKHGKLLNFKIEYKNMYSSISLWDKVSKDGVCRYAIVSLGLDANIFDSLKSEEQKKYESLDKMWISIFNLSEEDQNMI